MTDNGENMGVKVKPLVWHNFDAWTWWAEAVSGTYCVNERNGTWTGSLRFRDAVHIVYEVDDFDTVIVACNDDNRARVMAALIPATRAPVTVEDAARVPEIAALIKKAEALSAQASHVGLGAAVKGLDITDAARELSLLSAEVRAVLRTIAEAHQ